MQYLSSIILFSLAGGLLLLVVPEGSGRRVTALALGAAMAVAVLSPLGDLRAEDITDKLSSLAEGLAASGEADSLALQKEILTDELCAYIETRAESLGCPVQAEVELQWQAGTFTVAAVYLQGTCTEALVEELVRQLGCEKERIICRQ